MAGLEVVTSDPLFAVLAEMFEYVSHVTAKIALDELHQAQSAGAMVNPTVYVDKKKGGNEWDVKPFGSIIYVSSKGPLKEAVEEAARYVASRTSAFKNPTGFYDSAFRWFVNGKPAGATAPDAAKVGARGNVQLVNLAGYASPVENFIPDGIIFGAYTMLKAKYGAKLTIAQGFAPANAFDQQWPADRADARPMTIPYLMIGHPSATFKQRSKRPGHNVRRRERAAAKAAKAAKEGGH